MSLESEQHILGCAILDEDTVVKLLEIPEAWFLSNQHKIIHREFKRLTDNNLSCDMFALGDALNTIDGFKNSVGIDYINELAEGVPSLKYWNSYKTILFADYKKNNISKVFHN